MVILVIFKWKSTLLLIVEKKIIEKKSYFQIVLLVLNHLFAQK